MEIKTKVNKWDLLKLKSFCTAKNAISSVQSLSRVRLFETPMNHSTPGLPVHHQLPEFTQTHIHDAIYTSIYTSSILPTILQFKKEILLLGQILRCLWAMLSHLQMEKLHLASKQN